MPYWIELHCAAVMPDGRLARSSDSGCRSFNNAVPGLMLDNPRDVVQVHKYAETLGWRRRHGGWACPACRKLKRKPKIVSPGA